MQPIQPQPGSFVLTRGRPWLVEGTSDYGNKLTTVRLAGISDDTQGEALEVVWEAEIGARLLDEDAWTQIARDGTDDPEILAAYLRTLKWRTATAADRKLFQAPFRAGIRLDAYQLLPLRKALNLPRVNLLIADDVGLGKTVEAGLIVRELLLRRRIDFVVVAAPPSMTIQWQDELESKFGLAFTIIDRDRLAVMRRLQGFAVNPWATGSRFIVSHRLLADETYTAGLRDFLAEFRPRTLLILDEAHHAAPASGAKYAIDSQFTRVVRDIACRFEHRLFLSATPHCGHSNSFSALLEMLDPHRFTRGIPVRPGQLDAVMVRRLKPDLRTLKVAKFPKRVVEAIPLPDQASQAPELKLATMLADYGELRERRLGTMSGAEAGRARLVFVGLQQRLLSSVAAFAKTLKIHLKGLESAVDRDSVSTDVAVRFAQPELFLSEAEPPSDPDEQVEGRQADIDEQEALTAATVLGAAETDGPQRQAEIAHVRTMLDFAAKHADGDDARVRWMKTWIDANLCPDGIWNRRRLIVFTEFEDTRIWLERRLRTHVADTERAQDRIGVFSGITGADRREAIKRAFNDDPDREPIRILICTDAAREGINLQTRCHDLIHFDLPWNPSRIEQRNGRIDRKLQPEAEVFCRYFRYLNREEDRVLKALVEKTETIRDELGSAGKVLEDRIAVRLAKRGIVRGRADALAAEISAEQADELQATARSEMEEDGRLERLRKDLDGLRSDLERSRRRVGVDSDQLRSVIGAALAKDGFRLDEARGTPVEAVETFRFDPDHPAFGKDRTWADAFDDLRTGKRKPGERLGEWRRRCPLRSVSFEPPILSDDRDADDVVQVHLEHRMVRRLLSRFLSQGFQSDLKRATVLLGPGAEVRVVLIGRVALYGPGGLRLHEELVPVTARWTEGRPGKPLKVLGDRGSETTMEQLEKALDGGRAARDDIAERLLRTAQADVAELRPVLDGQAQRIVAEATADLVRIGEDEARSLTRLLEDRLSAIGKALTGFDPRQLSFDFSDDERRQKMAEHGHWKKRVVGLQREIAEEPARVRGSYQVTAWRVEPVGLIYLYPTTG